MFKSTCSSTKLKDVRDKILQRCIHNSVGFHHAGMVRADRDIV
jgi:replicative superfamily II helicase